MADNRTKLTTSSVAEFIDTISDPRGAPDAKPLTEVMQSASGEKPRMFGFGSYHYQYERGRGAICRSPVFRRVRPQLFFTTSPGPAAARLPTPGKHTTGKGCLYIKKLSDVDPQVLKAMLVESLTAIRGKQAKTA